MAAVSAVHPMAAMSSWGGLWAAALCVTSCHCVSPRLRAPQLSLPGPQGCIQIQEKKLPGVDQGTSGGRDQRGQEGEVVMRAFLSLL